MVIKNSIKLLTSPFLCDFEDIFYSGTQRSLQGHSGTNKTRERGGQKFFRKEISGGRGAGGRGTFILGLRVSFMGKYISKKKYNNFDSNLDFFMKYSFIIRKVPVSFSDFEENSM